VQLKRKELPRKLLVEDALTLNSDANVNFCGSRHMYLGASNHDYPKLIQDVKWVQMCHLIARLSRFMSWCFGLRSEIFLRLNGAAGEFCAPCAGVSGSIRASSKERVEIAAVSTGLAPVQIYPHMWLPRIGQLIAGGICSASRYLKS
jgi:hypothetical protein